MMNTHTPLNANHAIVSLLDSCVVAKPKIAVYISGGLDSTILLHHLAEKTKEPIHSYTFGFRNNTYDEFADARKVAEHYGTVHREVVIENFLDRFPQILRQFRKPHFNIWPYWLAESAFKDGCLNCFIGEGLDEHFGGYADGRSYLEKWVNHYAYVLPMYETVHRIFGLNLHVPFSNVSLDFQKTLPYWDSTGQKMFLKQAYKDVIPDFVLQRKKTPGRPDYQVLWRNELANRLQLSDEEIKHLLNVFATRAWTESQLGGNQ